MIGRVFTSSSRIRARWQESASAAADVTGPSAVGARKGAGENQASLQWESDLIGPERTIGGHPGKQPAAGALARAEREWKAAGRAIHRGAMVEAESTWDSESVSQPTDTVAISLPRQYDPNLSLALRLHPGTEDPDLL
jgi:hypothetical protein